MITLVLSIIVSMANAAVLPPGFVIKQFQDTRKKVTTMKIEQRVVYDNSTFNETLWFKGPDKFRAYIEKDGDSVLFIRNDKKCVVVASGARITSSELCNAISRNFYYNLLLPYGNFASYLKSLGIKTQDDVMEIQKVKDEYTKADNIFLLRNDKKPIYVIGVTNSEYESAVSESKSDKKNLTDKLLDKVKEKAPQVWMQTETSYPVRVFGFYPGDSSKALEIVMGSYDVDSNDFPFPKSIKVNVSGINTVSYAVKSFETNIGVTDDQLFSIANYNTKNPKTVDEAELKDTKKVLINYLKEYR